MQFLFFLPFHLFSFLWYSFYITRFYCLKFMLCKLGERSGKEATASWLGESLPFLVHISSYPFILVHVCHPPQALIGDVSRYFLAFTFLLSSHFIYYVKCCSTYCACLFGWLGWLVSVGGWVF